MSNIGSVGGGPPVYGGALPVSPASLTPDALLVYCATELHGMDAQINGQMTRQQAERDAQTTIADLNATLQPFEAGGIGANDAATKEQVLDQLKAAYDKLPEGSPDRAAVEAVFNRFRATACLNDDYTKPVSLAAYTPADAHADANLPDQSGHNLTSADEVTSISNQLNDIAGSIDKNGEIEMIGLQSLVAQRQTAVTLCTNLLSKLDETALAVAQNIK